MKSIAFFVFYASLVALPSVSAAASFDCSKASSVIEREICNDSELSVLDDRMAAAYSRALDVVPDLKTGQREWLKNIRQCEVRPPVNVCLSGAYKTRISALNFMGNTNRGLIGVEIRGISPRGDVTALEIGNVSPGSPAQDAGVEPGDFVREINGRQVVDMSTVYDGFNLSPGQMITLRLMRKDGSEKTVSMRLASRQVQSDASAEPPPVAAPVQAPVNTKSSSRSEKNGESTKTDEDSDSSGLGWLVLIGLGAWYYYKKKKKNAEAESSNGEAQAETSSNKQSNANPLEALYMEGVLHYKRGDLNRAKQLFEEAASNGHVESQFHLGKVMIEQSESSDDKSFVGGVGWIRIAAKHDHAQAALFLKDFDEAHSHEPEALDDEEDETQITHDYLCGDCGWHGDGDDVDLDDDGSDSIKCPDCGSYDLTEGVFPSDEDDYGEVTCYECGWVGNDSPRIRNDDEDLVCPSCHSSFDIRLSKTPRKNWFGDDRELILRVLAYNGNVFKDLDSELQNDRAVVLAACSSAVPALNLVPEKFRGDKEMVLAAVSSNGSQLEHASLTLRNDEEVVTQAVSDYPWAFEYASERLRGDKNLVLQVVANSGSQLAYASEALKADFDVVRTAVKDNGNALEYAVKELRSDRALGILALENTAGALEYVSEEMRSDKQIVLPLLGENGWALQYASDALRDDKEVVMAAVTNMGYSLQFASDRLRADSEVVKAAIAQDEDAAEYSLLGGAASHSTAAWPFENSDKPAQLGAVTQSVVKRRK